MRYRSCRLRCSQIAARSHGGACHAVALGLPRPREAMHGERLDPPSLSFGVASIASRYISSRLLQLLRAEAEALKKIDNPV